MAFACSGSPTERRAVAGEVCRQRGGVLRGVKLQEPQKKPLGGCSSSAWRSRGGAARCGFTVSESAFELARNEPGEACIGHEKFQLLFAARAANENQRCLKAKRQACPPRSKMRQGERKAGNKLHPVGETCPASPAALPVLVQRRGTPLPRSRVPAQAPSVGFGARGDRVEAHFWLLAPICAFLPIFKCKCEL